MIRSLGALTVAVALLTPFASAAPSPSPRASRTPRASSPLPSPSPSRSPGGAALSVGVWTVHASSVDANFKTGEFNTPAKVVATRVGGDVTADRANGNYKKHMIYLNGHVVMHDSSGNYGGFASAGSTHSSSPSTLTADKAQIDGDGKIYKAMGSVHYVQADTVVDADNGTLNDLTHELFLQGNVHIVQGKRNLSAQSVLYNTITGSAHAEGDVTMEFPSQLRRGLATPKPLKLPKNNFTEPVVAPAASPKVSPAASP